MTPLSKRHGIAAKDAIDAAVVLSFKASSF
jgi:hypothetical protein